MLISLSIQSTARVCVCEDVGGGVGGGGGVGVECEGMVPDNSRPLSLHQADEGQDCYHHWRVRRSVSPSLSGHYCLICMVLFSYDTLNLLFY